MSIPKEIVHFPPFKGSVERTVFNALRTRAYLRFDLKYQNFNDESFLLKDTTIRHIFIYDQKIGRRETVVGTYTLYFFPTNNLTDKENFLEVSLNFNAGFGITWANDCPDKIRNLFPVGKKKMEQKSSFP